MLLSPLPDNDDQIACEMTGHRHPWAYEEGEHGVTCTHCLGVVPEEYLATAYYSGKRRVATAKAVKSRIIDIGIMIATKSGVVTDPEVAKQLHARADKDHITSAEVILQQHWCATGGHPFMWTQSEAPLADGTIVYICGGCNGEISSTLLAAKPHIDLTDELNKLHAAQQGDPRAIAPPALIKPNPKAGIGGRHVDAVIVDDALPDLRTDTEREADENYLASAQDATEYEADANAAASRPIPGSSSGEDEQGIWFKAPGGRVDQMVIDDQAFVDDPLAIAMAETRPALAQRLQDARDHQRDQEGKERGHGGTRWAEAIERVHAERGPVSAQEWANTPTHPSSPEEAERWRRERLGAVRQMESLGTVFSPQVQHMLDETLSMGGSILADNEAAADASQRHRQAAGYVDPTSEEALEAYRQLREQLADGDRRLPPDDLVIRIVKDMRELASRVDALELSGSLASDLRTGAGHYLREATKLLNGMLPTDKHA